MGLYSIENINDHSKLGIWKKEESLYELNKNVLIHDEELFEYNKISNASRKKEWLTTRLLLKRMLGEGLRITYNETRKPSLSSTSYKISISHSKNFVSILLSSQNEPGIDIEHIADRVLKVKHKFLNDEELAWCSALSQYTLCWSAKEAIFKTFGKDVDFKDIVIHPFTLSERGHFEAKVLNKNNEPFNIDYRIVENDALTLTFRKNNPL